MTYPSGPTVSEFRPEGKLLKQHAGQPRFTRVSAIICIDDIPSYPKLQTVVLHNPILSLSTEACSETGGSWPQTAASCVGLPKPSTGLKNAWFCPSSRHAPVGSRSLHHRSLAILLVGGGRPVAVEALHQTTGEEVPC